MPELNIYDRDWPVWTYQEQLPPAKFVPDEGGRHGEIANVMVSGGCIVSGSDLTHSVLFSSVRVHSDCSITKRHPARHVTVGRGCRLSKVVIDRGCVTCPPAW
jgi:glucose-1-phosphate adenylyltransferase